MSKIVLFSTLILLFLGNVTAVFYAISSEQLAYFLPKSTVITTNPLGHWVDQTNGKVYFWGSILSSVDNLLPLYFANVSTTLDKTDSSALTSTLYGSTNTSAYSNQPYYLIQVDAVTRQIGWYKAFSATSVTYLNKVISDTAGNIYATGYYRGSLYNVASDPTGNSTDIYLAKFDINGNFNWFAKFGTTADDGCVGFEFEVNSTNPDAVWIAGNTKGSWFAPNVNGTYMSGVNTSSSDIFAFRVAGLATNNPTASWGTQWGGYGDDYGVTIDINVNYATNPPTQQLLVAGYSTSVPQSAPFTSRGTSNYPIFNSVTTIPVYQNYQGTANKQTSVFAVLTFDLSKNTNATLVYSSYYGGTTNPQGQISIGNAQWDNYGGFFIYGNKYLTHFDKTFNATWSNTASYKSATYINYEPEFDLLVAPVMNGVTVTGVVNWLDSTTGSIMYTVQAGSPYNGPTPLNFQLSTPYMYQSGTTRSYWWQNSNSGLTWYCGANVTCGVQYSTSNLWNTSSSTWRVGVFSIYPSLTTAVMSTAPLTTAPLTSHQFTSHQFTSHQFTSSPAYTTSPLTSAQYTSAQYTSAQYTSAQYTSAQYTSAQYTSAQYTSAQYTSAQYTSAQYTSAQYTSAEMTSAEMTSAEMTSAEMTSAEMTSAQYTSAPMTSAQYTSAQYTSAEMTSAEMTSAQYTSAPMTTAAMTTAASKDSHMKGDPIIVGFHGEKFNFDGSVGGIFNIYNDEYINVNSMFGRATDTTGTIMVIIAVEAGGHRISFDIKNHHDKESINVMIDGKNTTATSSSLIHLTGCIEVGVNRDGFLSIRTPTNEIKIAPRSPWENNHAQTGHIDREYLDFIINPPHKSVQHLVGGVIGQTAMARQDRRTENFLVPDLYSNFKSRFYKGTLYKC